jgi:hypothetical protein
MVPVTVDGEERGVGYGRPTAWLYGDKDPFYPMTHSRANFAAFEAAGGKGAFHEYAPPEGLNGHQIVSAPPLWGATLEAYLADQGLPAKTPYAWNLVAAPRVLQ